LIPYLPLGRKTALVQAPCSRYVVPCVHYHMLTFPTLGKPHSTCKVFCIYLSEGMSSLRHLIMVCSANTSTIRSQTSWRSTMMASYAALRLPSAQKSFSQLRCVVTFSERPVTDIQGSEYCHWVICHSRHWAGLWDQSSLASDYQSP